MKKLIFLSALITSSFFVKNADAQVGVHFNINVGPRPVYQQALPPVVDDYYYLPDAEAYYSVPERVYYYRDEGRWISSPRLVGRFHDYDYSRMRHFAINEPRPYLRNDYYRDHFNGQQFAVRDNRDFGRNQRFNSPRERENYGRNDYSRNNQRFIQRGPDHDYHDQHDDRGGRY